MDSFKIAAGVPCHVRRLGAPDWEPHVTSRELRFTRPPYTFGIARVFLRDGWELKVDYRAVVLVKTLDSVPAPLNFKNHGAKKGRRASARRKIAAERGRRRSEDEKAERRKKWD